MSTLEKSSLENVSLKIISLKNVLSENVQPGKSTPWKKSTLEYVLSGISPFYKMSPLENALTPTIPLNYMHLISRFCSK